MEEQWLKDLKKRSEGYEREAPAGLWDDIQRSLDGKRNADASRNNVKVVPLWRRWAAVAAAVLLLLSIGFVALYTDAPIESEQVATLGAEQKGNVASGNADVEQPQVAEVTTTKETVVESDRREPIGSRNAVANTASSEAVTDGGVANDGNVVEEEPTVTMPRPAEQTEASKPKKEGKREHNRSVMDDYAKRNGNSSGEHYAYNSKNRNASSSSGNKWSAGLYASNMTGNNNSSAGYSSLTLGANPFSTMPRQDTWTTNAMANIMFNNLSVETGTEIKHHQPVRFGASVKYAFSERWGLESGVSYTWLKSELTSGSENDHYATEQTIHYLGIPLKVNFTVWHNNHFRAYVTAGGMMEIPLSGKSETDYISSGRVVDHDSEDVDVDRLQWSVAGAVGFQYNFIDNLGIYVEPGVSYYFDDGSDVLTIYKDKQFNFNFQVGLRFEIN